MHLFDHNYQLGGSQDHWDTLTINFLLIQDVYLAGFEDGAYDSRFSCGRVSIKKEGRKCHELFLYRNNKTSL